MAAREGHHHDVDNVPTALSSSINIRTIAPGAYSLPQEIKTIFKRSKAMGTSNTKGRGYYPKNVRFETFQNFLVVALPYQTYSPDFRK